MSRFVKMLVLMVVAGAALSWLPAFAIQQSPSPKIDFARDIQPILATNCYGCHGAQKANAQLRLDVKVAAIKGGMSGAVILPGNSKDSCLLHRLQGLNGETQMPLGRAPLTPAQIKLIKRWVDEGAVWPEDAKSHHHQFSRVIRSRRLLNTRTISTGSASAR